MESVSSGQTGEKRIGPLDPNRFDVWTRNRALRFSRREALRLAAASGVGIAAGARAHSTLAQTTCSWTLTGGTLAGQFATSTIEGTLQFSVGADGVFTQASFTRPGDAPVAVTGSLVGRAVDIRISLTPDQEITLSGTADQGAPECPANGAGLLSGPLPGDLGVWQINLGAGAPVLSAGSSGTSACAQGEVLCGGSCSPACPSGQTLDQVSCTCVANQLSCQPDQGSCVTGLDCCSGFCDNTSGTCQPCMGAVCGDMGCIDVLNDPFNCGSCGTTCSGNTSFCLGGMCQCTPDNEPAASSGHCCSQKLVAATGLCGCAGIGEWCQDADCCPNSFCLDNGTGLKTCCKLAGNSCTSDSECCFSSGYSPRTLCINGVCTKES
jgi:hypothetical protein